MSYLGTSKIWQTLRAVKLYRRDETACGGQLGRSRSYFMRCEGRRPLGAARAAARQAKTAGPAGRAAREAPRRFLRKLGVLGLGRERGLPALRVSASKIMLIPHRPLEGVPATRPDSRIGLTQGTTPPNY